MYIKECRMAAELTQEEFSKLLGIPIDTIKNWDSGRRNPPKWAQKLIIEKVNMHNKGIVSTILTQDDVSKIMTALTIAKIEAKEDIKTAKSQAEKELRESTVKKWEDAQWEIGKKLGYYTEPEEAHQKEDAEDSMMKFLKSL